METKIFHFTEEGKIFARMDNIKKISHVPQKIAVFVYDDRYQNNPLELFKKYNPQTYQNTTFSIEFENELWVCLKFNIVKNDVEVSKERDAEVFVLVSKKTPIVIMLTSCKREQFEDKLNYFNKFYPFLSRIFYRSFEINELLASAENLNKLNISVKSYVVKRYYEKPKTEVCYEDINYGEAFRKASENYLWVDSIQLRIDEKGMLRINRRGVISFYGFDFSSVYSWFITKIIEKQTKLYMSVLKNKSRTLDNLEPKPIKFTILDDIFKTPEDIQQLIKLIGSKLSNWGYSILYNDGPFLSMILHDYVSGSSYDLLIGSASEILIIPQTQVTPISFNQLINFLMNNYDGEIENG